MLGTSTVRPGLIGNPKRRLPTPKRCILHKCREIALPPPICSAFHKRSSGSASLLPHERVIRSRLRSPSLSNGNSPLRRNRRSGSRHIPQRPFFVETGYPDLGCTIRALALEGGQKYILWVGPERITEIPA